jgi:hypothetical protein
LELYIIFKCVNIDEPLSFFSLLFCGLTAMLEVHGRSFVAVKMVVMSAMCLIEHPDTHLRFLILSDSFFLAFIASSRSEFSCIHCSISRLVINVQGYHYSCTCTLCTISIGLCIISMYI